MKQKLTYRKKDDLFIILFFMKRNRPKLFLHFPFAIKNATWKNVQPASFGLPNKIQKKNMQENFLLNFKLFRITVETFEGKMILHE